MAELFRFPNPVNEISARLVAAGVVLLSAATLVFAEPWLLVPLAYGFVARVLTGPTLSPLGQLVTRVVVPRLPVAPKYVAGPPKRFAQGMGAAMTLTAVLLHFGFGETDAAYAVVGLVIVAATLESVFAFCLGCTVFAGLMRLGVIPDEVCERCNNLRSDMAGRAGPPRLPLTRNSARGSFAAGRSSRPATNRGSASQQ